MEQDGAPANPNMDPMMDILQGGSGLGPGAIVKQRSKSKERMPEVLAAAGSMELRVVKQRSKSKERTPPFGNAGTQSGMTLEGMPTGPTPLVEDMMNGPGGPQGGLLQVIQSPIRTRSKSKEKPWVPEEGGPPNGVPVGPGYNPEALSGVPNEVTGGYPPGYQAPGRPNVPGDLESVLKGTYEDKLATGMLQIPQSPVKMRSKSKQ